MGWRIAVVNSYYSSDRPSGENEQVKAQIAALRKSGNTVGVFAVSTDRTAAEPFYQIRAAARVASGVGRGVSRRDLYDFQPDLVHVHNLFPNFGRRWVHRLRVPLVATLQNYRPFCAEGLLHRDGRTCMDCFSGPLPGLLNGCYRGHWYTTAPLTIAQLRRDPVLEVARLLIVLSATQADYLCQAGVDGARLAVVPNFVPTNTTTAQVQAVIAGSLQGA